MRHRQYNLYIKDIRELVMGLTFVAVQVHGKNGKAETFNLLVDTGSVYTWIEGDSLLRLGIEPRVEKRKFRTIEGRGSQEVSERQNWKSTARKRLQSLFSQSKATHMFWESIRSKDWVSKSIQSRKS